MQYHFDEIIHRESANSVKWSKGVSGRPLKEGAISMWVADMDFACAQPILDAIRASAERRIFGYTVWKDDDYLDALCGYYARRHGWTIDPETVLFCGGVVSGLNHVVRALTQPGDRIMLQSPVYTPFFGAVEGNRREVVDCPLLHKAGGRYEMDFDALEAAAKDAKMLILCSPHNPVGRVWTEEELRRVYEICERNDVLILSDEIHCDLVRGGVTQIPLQKLFPDSQRIVTCVASTKTFNMAGLGCAHIIVPNTEMRAAVEQEAGHDHADPVAHDAAKAAYRHGDEWLDQVLPYLDENFAYFKAAVQKELPGCDVFISEGTYLAWLDVHALCSDTMALELKLEDAGLAVESGKRFGALGEGFLRVNLACPRSRIDQAVAILKRVLFPAA